MKQEKQIEVYDLDHNAIPERVDRFLAFWQEKIDLVPREFRDSASIKIEVLESFGCPMLAATVSYIRLETDEEEQVRERKGQAKQDLIKKHELEDLARLKQKYGEV